MLFSILVPVYQVEQYLPECLQSIENQTCQDFEVVLVDDGSRDGSGAMCDVFAQKYPDRVTVIHKKNEGLISARRVGIQSAKGEYCIFLDSDDLLEIDCLRILKEKIEQFDAPDMVIYRFSYYDDGKCTPCRYQDFGPNQVYTGIQKQRLYESLLEGPALYSLCTKAIKTSILQSDVTDYRQYYGNNMAEDLLQSLYPITAAEKILCISEPLYLYRYNQESVSRSFRLDTLDRKKTIHVYRKMLEYLPVWGLDTPEAREKLHTRWLNETIYYLEKHFIAAKGFRGKMAVLRYPWTEFVGEGKGNLQSQNQMIWDCFRKGKLISLFLLLVKRDMKRKLVKCYRRIRGKFNKWDMLGRK